MSSDATTGNGVAVPLSAAAFQVATLAAQEIGVSTADWVALAVLSAAAEQSGVGGTGGGPEAAAAAADPVPDTGSGAIAAALARLESKLDAALARAPNGAPGRPAP